MFVSVQQEVAHAKLSPVPSRSGLISPECREALETIQRHILWLATLIVYHANRIQSNHNSTKADEHQASPASMVSIMTVLYFHSEIHLLYYK